MKVFTVLSGRLPNGKRCIASLLHNVLMITLIMGSGAISGDRPDFQGIGRIPGERDHAAFRFLAAKSGVGISGDQHVDTRLIPKLDFEHHDELGIVQVIYRDPVKGLAYARVEEVVHSRCLDDWIPRAK